MLAFGLEDDAGSKPSAPLLECGLFQSFLYPRLITHCLKCRLESDHL